MKNIKKNLTLLQSLTKLSKQELEERCKQLTLTNQQLETQLEVVQCLVEEEEEIKAKGIMDKKPLTMLDFSKYSKRRIAFKFLYIGWDCQGFMSQYNTKNTIEFELFEALTKSKMVKDISKANYSRCGRTDKYVSAFGQVIALDVPSDGLADDDVADVADITKESGGESTATEIYRLQDNHQDVNENVAIPYTEILNSYLPQDIRIIAHASVPSDFDARYSCKMRQYKYYFLASHLDIKLMNQAAQKLTGEHDFRNFCKFAKINTYIRTIHSFSVRRLGTSITSEDICEMDIVGSGFLWHQVRCMVGVLMMIGLQLEKQHVIDYLLDTDKCLIRPLYDMAFPYPLVLYDCIYDNVNWVYSQECKEHNVNRIEQMWSEKTIESTMLHTLFKDLRCCTALNTDPSFSKVFATLPNFCVDEYKPIQLK